MNNFFIEQKEKTKNPVWDYGWMIILFALIFFTWMLFLAIMGQISLKGWEEAGKFGDTFGALNSLFSGMAFAALIVAVVLQRQELIEQRKELVLARKQFERSAKAQEKSEAALSMQVKALEKTAEINGINALLGYYLPMVEKSQSELNNSNLIDSNLNERYKQEFELLISKREDLIEKLEKLIK